jgi:hypothetical protein
MTSPVEGAGLPAPQGPDISYDGDKSEELPSDSPRYKANVFANALARVAILNGTPLEARSWRHSSISSRMKFVRKIADDPEMRVAFLRSVRIIKLTILFCAALAFLLFLLRMLNAGEY